jgi:hypothetical protein
MKKKIIIIAKNLPIGPWAWDLLLPLAAVLHLSPVDPSLCALPAVLWLALQLLLAPKDRRWALWPLLFVLLVMGRSWLLNEATGIISSNDFLLIIIAMLAASGISADRWPRLIKLPLIALPFIALNVGPRPWSPNPLAGVNQGAYLLGLLLVLALSWWSSQPKGRERWLAGLASLLATALVWQTGSRAALLASLAALLLVVVQEHSASAMQLLRRLSLAALGLGGVFIAVSLSKHATSGLSDLGRLEIFNCYASLPFSGNNRLIYGIGFLRQTSFCQDLVTSGRLSHAHNLFLQLWANAGILGLLGLALLATMLWQAWRAAALSPLLRHSGLAVLVYVLIQACVDVSVSHWPVAQIFTGILLAIPLARTPADAV